MAWPTVRAVIKVHPERANMSSQGLDSAFAHYERLSASTAQRVVRFWQVRRSA
jgi:ABC-type Fe2+-enterobactin transport system substrate-binding protein